MAARATAVPAEGNQKFRGLSPQALRDLLGEVFSAVRDALLVEHEDPNETGHGVRRCHSDTANDSSSVQAAGTPLYRVWQGDEAVREVRQCLKSKAAHLRSKYCCEEEPVGSSTLGSSTPTRYSDTTAPSHSDTTAPAVTVPGPASTAAEDAGAFSAAGTTAGFED